MNLSAIKTDLYSRLRYASTPATAIQDRLLRHLNEAHREILALPGMMRLREDLLPVSATANQPRSALPQAVARLRHILDRTNMRPLTPLTLQDIRARNPGRVNTGAPEGYAVVGFQPVALQPSDASEVFLKSTSASDTGTAYVEGIRSNGSLVSKSVVMTGTTAVSLSSAEPAIVEVTKFYLSTAAIGDVTLLEDSGSGTELAKIAIGRTFARYLTVEWDPIPATSATFYADCIRQIPDLANATDEPLLPDDFHYLLGLRARMKEYEVTSDAERFLECKGEWERGLGALRSFVLNDGGQLASLRSTASGWSQLGPQYPAGS